MTLQIYVTLVLVAISFSVLADAHEALALVESRNMAKCIGDGGKAVGKHQFHKAAWQDTTKFRASQGLKIWPYSYASNPAVSDCYAVSRIKQLRLLLSSALGRAPSLQEVYAAYNMGITGFARRGYKMARCPLATRRAAERFEQLTLSDTK